MKYLTTDHWSVFKELSSLCVEDPSCCTKAKRSCCNASREQSQKNAAHKAGLLFECLTCQLLQAKYPQQHWKRTLSSWDGGKDFYIKEISSQKSLLKWAECKHYQEPISLKIIAPTLIMSTIDSVHEILFFSYSYINREARKKIIAFAQIQRKKVYFYDDEALENLIFYYKDQIEFSRFFPKYNAECPACPPARAESEVNVYVPRHNSTYTLDALKAQQLKVNDIIVLQIALQNPSIQPCPVTIQITVEPQDGHYCFELPDPQEPEDQNDSLRDSKQIDLDSGQSVFYPYPIKVIHFADTLILPKIEISWADQVTSLTDYSVRGLWLLETPYIGNIERIENFMRHAVQAISTVIFLEGESGVGKSRFYRELQDCWTLKQKPCIMIDGEKFSQSDTQWIKKILAQMYLLPMDEDGAKEWRDEQDELVSIEAKDILLQILYNVNYPFYENISQVAELIAKAQEQSETLLILDNIQFFGDRSIMLINELLAVYERYQMKNVNLVLVFNSDYVVKGSRVFTLLERLRSFSLSDKAHYFKEIITGFSLNDAELYLQQCLGINKEIEIINSRAYQQIISKILNQSQHKSSSAKNHLYNPLLLEQQLIYLCNCKVLSRQNGYFHLAEDQQAFMQMEDLPRDINDYFSKRYFYAQKKMPDLFEDIRKILYCVLYFEKLPVGIMRGLQLNKNAVYALCDMGILTKNEDYVFYHQLIQKFFVENQDYFDDLDFSEDIWQYLCANGGQTKYPAQFFLCAAGSYHVDATIVIKSLQALMNERIPRTFILRYCDQLFAEITARELFSVLEPAEMMRFFSKYCYEAQLHSSFYAAYDLSEKIYECYLKPLAIFAAESKEYVAFVWEYLNMLLVEHKNQRVIEVVGETVSCLHLQDADQTIAMHTNAGLLCQLLNRRHVAYNRIDRLEATDLFSLRAKEDLNRSMEIATIMQDTVLQIQNEIDYGYLYYTSGALREYALCKAETLKHWSRAYHIWQADPAVNRTWDVGVFYHRALAQVMDNQYESALEAIRQAEIYYFNKLDTPYFYEKALLLKAIIYCMQKEDSDKVMKAVDAVAEKCGISQSSGMIPIANYVRAKMYELIRKSPDEACLYYHDALRQLLAKCETSEEEQKAAVAIMDICLSAKKLDEKSQFAELNTMKNKALSARITEMLQQPIFSEETRQKYQIFSLIQSSDGQVNYPCP